MVDLYKTALDWQILYLCSPPQFTYIKRDLILPIIHLYDHILLLLYHMNESWWRVDDRSRKAKMIACTPSQAQLCIDGVNSMLLNHLGSLGLHALGLSRTKLYGVICALICFSRHGERCNTVLIFKLHKTPPDFPSAWRWVGKRQDFHFSVNFVCSLWAQHFFFLYCRCYSFPSVEILPWG